MATLAPRLRSMIGARSSGCCFKCRPPADFYPSPCDGHCSSPPMRRPWRPIRSLASNPEVAEHRSWRLGDQAGPEACRDRFSRSASQSSQISMRRSGRDELVRRRSLLHATSGHDGRTDHPLSTGRDWRARGQSGRRRACGCTPNHEPSNLAIQPTKNHGSDRFFQWKSLKNTPKTTPLVALTQGFSREIHGTRQGAVRLFKNCG